MQTSYVAQYEDAAAALADARKRGYAGPDDGDWMDYCREIHLDYTVARRFPSLALAASWVEAAIKAGKTCFSSGSVYERVKVERRCQYCVCGGYQQVRQWDIGPDGDRSETALSSDCYDDD